LAREGEKRIANGILAENTEEKRPLGNLSVERGIICKLILNKQN